MTTDQDVKIISGERRGLDHGIYSLGELRLFLTFYAGPAAGEHALTWLQKALNPIDHRRHQPDYNFADLVSLLVVSELVSHGLPMRKIKESERSLREQTDHDRPFTHRKLSTDGTRIYIDGAHADQLEETGRARGQQVQALVLAGLLQQVEYSGEWAVRWMPNLHVVVDPKRQFGEPTVAGTRVPTSDVFDVASTTSAKQAAERFRIPLEAALGAIQFEKQLSTSA